MANLVSQAKFFNSSNRIATTNNTNSTALSNCFSYSFGTFAESVHFENAHRTVPNNHLRIFQSISISNTSFFTNVKSHAVLVQFCNFFSSVFSISSKCFCHYEVSRQQHIYAVCFSLSQQRFCQFNFIFFNQGFTHLVALCCQEGVSHTATNEEGINFIQKVFNYADFIGNFCTTNDCSKGMQGFSNSLANKSDFFFQKETSSSRKEMSYSFNGSVSTMGHAKAVINIQICQRSKLFSKFHVIFFFFLMEAQVFQKQELTSLQIFSSSFSYVAYAVRSKGDFFTKKLT